MNKQYKSVPVEPTKEMIKAACDFDLAFDIETNDEYIPGLYQSMLKAAPQAPVSAELLALPDKWQPIETAPKDGTPILIWQPDNRHHDEIEGHKFDDLRYAIGYWRVWAQSDWSAAWGNRNQAHVNPTHWMPLPAPPQEGE